MNAVKMSSYVCDALLQWFIGSKKLMVYHFPVLVTAQGFEFLLPFILVCLAPDAGIVGICCTSPTDKKKKL